MLINRVLGFFGYVKIPLALVQLSIEQEAFLKTLIRVFDNTPGIKGTFKVYLNNQRAMTEFLRTGRLLTKNEPKAEPKDLIL